MEIEVSKFAVVSKRRHLRGRVYLWIIRQVIALRGNGITLQFPGWS